jgi:hypothetical protein
MTTLHNLINAGSSLPSLKSNRCWFGAGFVNRFFSSKRLTNTERNSFNVPQHLHEVIIGSCLGDLNVRKQTNFACLRFTQGMVNKDYIYHLFNLFSSYSNMGTPKHYEFLDKRNNKVNTSISFHTYSLPCFNYYYELFYVERVKGIPLNIGDLLTPVSLAYWAMDDGYKNGNGFMFCTDSYTLKEVEILIKALKDNFDLNSTNHTKGIDSYRIYIKTESMDKFRSLVTPYFHSSMMHKLAIDAD